MLKFSVPNYVMSVTNAFAKCGNLKYVCPVVYVQCDLSLTLGCTNIEHILTEPHVRLSGYANGKFGLWNDEEWD